MFTSVVLHEVTHRQDVRDGIPTCAPLFALNVLHGTMAEILVLIRLLFKKDLARSCTTLLDPSGEKRDAYSATATGSHLNGPSLEP
jgi:Mlc titration factor MtfA (ptsG expression regulator)